MSAVVTHLNCLEAVLMSSSSMIWTNNNRVIFEYSLIWKYFIALDKGVSQMRFSYLHRYLVGSHWN